MRLVELQEMTARYPGIRKLTLSTDAYDTLLVQASMSMRYPMNEGWHRGRAAFDILHFNGAEGEVLIAREIPFGGVDPIDGTLFTAGAIIEGPK